MAIVNRKSKNYEEGVRQLKKWQEEEAKYKEWHEYVERLNAQQNEEKLATKQIEYNKYVECCQIDCKSYLQILDFDEEGWLPSRRRAQFQELKKRSSPRPPPETKPGTAGHFDHKIWSRSAGKTEANKKAMKHYIENSWLKPASPKDRIGDAAKRTSTPITTGCIDYFPDALLAVARLSVAGNEQHNPGELLHWAKDKSTDEADCVLRHLIDRGKRDVDGVRHTTKVAWRALALLQRELEGERNAQEAADRGG